MYSYTCKDPTTYDIVPIGDARWLDCLEALHQILLSGPLNVKRGKVGFSIKDLSKFTTRQDLNTPKKEEIPKISLL